MRMRHQNTLSIFLTWVFRNQALTGPSPSKDLNNRALDHVRWSLGSSMELVTGENQWSAGILALRKFKSPDL